MVAKTMSRETKRGRPKKGKRCITRKAQKEGKS
jgi:hypothetical protein